MKEEILRLERVTRSYGGVTLINSFNLHIFKGEILGLLCINDHGKEALIELICKNVPIDYGNVYFMENLVNSYKQNSYSYNEVLVIEKPIRLVELLSVADNIFVLRKKSKMYIVNPKTLSDQIRRCTEDLGIHINANELVLNLSFYEKCIVLLIKAYIMGIQLVLLRDISNFVSEIDMKKINQVLKILTAENMTFLYICNHHEEAYKICDRVALMENGRVVKNLDKANFSEKMIIPYTLDFYRNGYMKKTNPIQKNSLAIKFSNVKTENIHALNFEIYKGECVVFLDRNNTSLEDIKNLFAGDIKPRLGNITLQSDKSLKKSVVVIEENPIATTLFKEMSYLENLCFLAGGKVRDIWMSNKIKKSVICEYEDIIGEDIYSNDIRDLSIISLYNLVYYRVHLYNPKLVVCVQPFWGADMYARHHIICLINELIKKNISVVILAVSLSDALYAADRLLVLEDGLLKREYLNKDFDEFNKENRV